METICRAVSPKRWGRGVRSSPARHHVMRLWTAELGTIVFLPQDPQELVGWQSLETFLLVPVQLLTKKPQQCLVAQYRLHRRVFGERRKHSFGTPRAAAVMTFLMAGQRGAPGTFQTLTHQFPQCFSYVRRFLQESTALGRKGFP